MRLSWLKNLVQSQKKKNNIFMICSASLHTKHVPTAVFILSHQTLQQPHEASSFQMRYLSLRNDTWLAQSHFAHFVPSNISSDSRLLLFSVLGLELRTSSLLGRPFTTWATSPALFWCMCVGYFQDRTSQSTYLGWPWTVILLISASFLARIPGVSHWRPAPDYSQPLYHTVASGYHFCRVI
jgi:hypothetical protein